jgi:hypothetical protein
MVSPTATATGEGLLAVATAEDVVVALPCEKLAVRVAAA